MSSWWPFSKIYNRTCADGSVKTVYKNIDDAFPLFIPGWQGNLSSTVKGAEQLSGSATAEYATKIQGLLYTLDELNQGLMMTFRGAYVVYQNDPCAHAAFFEREVEKLLDEQRRLRALKMQIEGLIALAGNSAQQNNEFLKIFSEIVHRMGNYSFPKLSSSEIDDARQITQNILGGEDDVR